MPGRPDVGNGSAEAARWVADALRNVPDWFPEMSEEQLRGPLQQAFEVAGRAVRGEQEFHSVFEAELRRAIEERSVIGSAGSVLPAGAAGSPKTFPLVATAAAETGPADVDAEPEGDGDRAQALALRVGALRFHDGLSPDEIRAALGVDEDYYSKAIRWLLGRADHTLGGDYPRHLDRRRMLSHAAGIASNEESFAVERHVRECPGCATYLADLFDATATELRTGPKANLSPQAPQVSYTRENTWTPDVRPRRRAPFLTLKADELRGYARSAEAAAAASPAVDAVEVPPIRPTPRPARDSTTGRPVPWRRAFLRFAVVATLLLVLVTAGLVALTSGGDDLAPNETAERDGAAERNAGPSDAELAARARERRRARNQAAAREQAARQRASARARRRSAQRRRQQAQRRGAPAPSAPAPVSPAPSGASSGSGGSSEFGLEP